MGNELFILYSQDVPLLNRVYYFEGDARHAAEEIARHHRGARVSVARIIATVREPLPALDWDAEAAIGVYQESDTQCKTDGFTGSVGPRR